MSNLSEATGRVNRRKGDGNSELFLLPVLGPLADNNMAVPEGDNKEY